MKRKKNKRQEEIHLKMWNKLRFKQRVYDEVSSQVLKYVRKRLNEVIWGQVSQQLFQQVSRNISL